MQKFNQARSEHHLVLTLAHAAQLAAASLGEKNSESYPEGRARRHERLTAEPGGNPRNARAQNKSVATQYLEAIDRWISSRPKFAVA